MSDPSRAHVAYHEAGHIATLAEFGIEIFGANIEHTEGTRYRAAVQSENLFWGRHVVPDGCGECFMRCLKHITLNLSGPVAEARFDPEYKADLEYADYKESIATALLQCQDSKRAYDLLNYLLAHADQIVDLRWRQVEEVARALLVRSTLTGIEISAILAAVPPRRPAKKLKSLDPLFLGRAFEKALIIRDGRLPQPRDLEPRCVYTRPLNEEEAAADADDSDTGPGQQPNHADDHAVTQKAAA